MALGPDNLHQHIVLAYDRHQQMIEAAAQNRLLTQSQVSPSPMRISYSRRLCCRLGDLLITWGMQLKGDTFTSSTAFPTMTDLSRQP
jgi:hypothetical protein